MVHIRDIDLSTFSQDELKVLAAQAIRRIQNPQGGIGTDLFEAVITIVPQPSVEALVVDNPDNPQRIYLTWREDQHYYGWHFPGTFIRFGESFEDALRRVVQREVSAGVRAFRSADDEYSWIDSRGHTVGTVWMVQPDGEPTGGEWFSIAEPPDPTLPHHVSILQRVFKQKR